MDAALIKAIKMVTGEWFSSGDYSIEVVYDSAIGPCFRATPLTNPGLTSAMPVRSGSILMPATAVAYVQM
jgi:hypothetical protein